MPREGQEALRHLRVGRRLKLVALVSKLSAHQSRGCWHPEVAADSARVTPPRLRPGRRSPLTARSLVEQDCCVKSGRWRSRSHRDRTRAQVDCPGPLDGLYVGVADTWRARILPQPQQQGPLPPGLPLETHYSSCRHSQKSLHPLHLRKLCTVANFSNKIDIFMRR